MVSTWIRVRREPSTKQHPSSQESGGYVPSHDEIVAAIVWDTLKNRRIRATTLSDLWVNGAAMV